MGPGASGSAGTTELPFLQGGGEMGARMRGFDWSNHALGHPRDWPQSLRTAVGICLNCRFPIILFWGPTYLHLYNDEYRSILGSKHPALGKTGAEVWPEIWHTIESMLDTVRSTGQATRSRDLMLEISRGGGARTEECWFSFSYSPVLDEAGRIAGVFCPVIETTETVRAQRRLEAEGGRLKGLFEQAPTFMAVLEGPEHVFVLANDQYQQLFGPRPLIGLTVREAFPEVVGQNALELLDEAFTMGKALTVRGFPARVRRPGGAVEETVFVDMVYQPTRNADGTVRGIFLHGVDVTSHVRTQRRAAFLVRLDDETRAISDPEEIAHAMMRLLRIELGAQRASYFEVEPGAARARVIRDDVDGIASLAGRTFVIDDFGAAFARAMREDAALVLHDVGEASLTPEESERFKDIQIGAVIIFPLHKDGELTALVGVYHGVARRWAPEEVELVKLAVNRCWELVKRAHADRAIRESDRRKEEFIATLAHELRNPLAPLRNALALLGRRDSSVPVTHLHRMMERQVDHLVRLTDDLLDVSRISQAKVQLSLAVVDLREPVRQAVETSRTWMDAGGHALNAALPDDPVFVEGDAVRLTQIVSNLLNNAAKYTPHGGHITIGLKAEGPNAVLSVRDDGIGIDPALQGRVFQMFAQIPDGAHRTGDGLGIGLALVQSLVRLHHGTVAVHSAGVSRGSTFVVRLPLTDRRPEPIGHAKPGTSPTAPQRVLIVDDNRDAADAIALLVSAMGCVVEVAYDGATALQLAERSPPTVALLDIGMPQMDGYELARRLRATRFGERVRLVALTGWGQDSDRRASFSAGFDHHLVKPVTAECLAEVLGKGPRPESGREAATGGGRGR